MRELTHIMKVQAFSIIARQPLQKGIAVFSRPIASLNKFSCIKLTVSYSKVHYRCSIGNLNLIDKLCVAYALEALTLTRVSVCNF